MSLFCFGNQHKCGILELVHLKNTFPWRLPSSNSSCTWAHKPRKEVACVYWVAKVLPGPRAEAVKCLLNPLESGCNCNYPLPQKPAGKKYMESVKMFYIFTTSVLRAVWHFPLSKRNNWKTRITAIIKKGTKSQKTPATFCHYLVFQWLLPDLRCAAKLRVFWRALTTLW